MLSRIRSTPFATLLATVVVLGIAASLMLFVAQRSRAVAFDVPELVALGFGLFASGVALLGLRWMIVEFR